MPNNACNALCGVKTAEGIKRLLDSRVDKRSARREGRNRIYAGKEYLSKFKSWIIDCVLSKFKKHTVFFSLSSAYS